MTIWKVNGEKDEREKFLELLTAQKIVFDGAIYEKRDEQWIYGRKSKEKDKNLK